MTHPQLELSKSNQLNILLINEEFREADIFFTFEIDSLN